MSKSEVKPCGRCGGSGKITVEPKPTVFEPWPRPEEKECPVCKGTGWVRI